jgi:DNA polymerase elongation subunit (family B)
MSLLRFKYLDARDFHIENEDDDDVKEDYIIRLFGRTPLEDTNYPDKSVCITVTGFTPFFFVKLPTTWTRNHAKGLFNSLQEENKDLIQYSIRTKFDFDGFQGDNDCTFIQLIFRTGKSMRNSIYKLSRPYYYLGKRHTFILYESNIDPILKLMHIKEISGCSWIKIDTENIETTRDISHCDIEGNVHWEDIYSSKEDNEAGTYCRLRILSYDIETMSTDPHGGFPQATREGDSVIQVGMTFNYFQHSECYKKYLISYKDCDPIDECEIINCSTEKELLVSFIKIILKEDPDIITGYNIFGFDNKYMYDRANRISSFFLKKFSEWGRLKDHQCNFVVKSLSSSALGDNTLYFFESEGRVQIDLYKVIQRDHNLEMYKLDFVSSHFNQNAIKNLTSNTFETPNTSGLEKDGYFKIKMIENLSGVEDFYTEEKYHVEDINGKTITFTGPSININTDEYTLKWCMAKDDLPPQKIFEYWDIDNAHRQIIGKYCIKDCVLVNFLMEKLDTVSTNMAMSYVCWVPLYYIFIRGQGIKAFSLVAQQCRKDNYIIPTIKKTDFVDKMCHITGNFKTIESDRCTFEECTSNLEKVVILKEFETGERACEKCNRLQYYTDYEGAKVYEPIPGVYWEPISVLDYASLYPRSIISRNMSWETQVLDLKFDNLPDYKYYDVSYKDSREKTINCRFAQKKSTDGTFNLGIIPKILFNLLNERDVTKKKMKKESDPFKKKILDGHQLALKITANSLYGQLGAVTSPVYRKDIAACTTAIGQHMLAVAQDFMENKFVDTLVECIETPEKYTEVSEDEKDFIKMVFDKYTMDPKIIYGDSVTGDTPLLLMNNGDVYLKTIESIFNEKKSKAYPGFKLEDIFLTNKEQCNSNYLVWTNGKWSKIKRVIRHLTNKEVYRINTLHGSVDVTEDHSLLDENMNLLKPTQCGINEVKLLHSYPEYKHIINNKKNVNIEELSLDIPDNILNSDNTTRFMYFKECYEELGMKYFCSKNKLIIAKWYYLIKSIGYKPIIKNYENTYWIYLDTEYTFKKEIVSIQKLDKCNRYVYDLETETGVFQAGIGEIIVKNTDSVFTNFQLRDPDDNKQTDAVAREICIKLGILAGKLVKPHLDYPHDLEYEKTFHPWLVICKKKYAGSKYEENPNKFSMNYMGIVLKRRDNAKIVKKVCGGILNILFKERDYQKVEEYVKEMLLDIIQNKFDITYFVTTKKLGGTYKGLKLTTDRKGVIGENGSWDWYDVKCGQAHVKLCQRMKERDPGSAPQVNDRISFVQVFDITDEDAKKKLQGEKIEEASYVLEHKLQIDYLYYIENQIENPACQFLELIIKNPEEKIFRPIKEEIESKRRCSKIKLNGGIFKPVRGSSKKEKTTIVKEISPKTKRMIDKLKAPAKIKVNDAFQIMF